MTAPAQAPARGPARAARPWEGDGPTRALKAAGSAVLSLVVVVVLWQSVVTLFHVNRFIVQPPGQVWRYLVSGVNAHANRLELQKALATTVRDALIGYVAGTVVAVACACGFVLRKAVEQTVMPLALVLRTVPLVALAPIITLVLGRGLRGIAAFAGIVTFFPTLVLTVFGLRAVSAQSVELMRSYGASRLTVLRKVQLPTALPSIFASARIAVPLAIIGASLAEFFATGGGIGSYVALANGNLNLQALWAAIAVTTIVTVTSYGLVAVAEAAVLRRFAPDQAAARRR